MNKRFETIKNNIGTLIQNTDTTMLTNIGVWVNNRYEDLLESYPWRELYLFQTVTATASVSAYGLNDNVDRLIYVYDSAANNYLNEIDEQELYKYYANTLYTTGSPNIYVVAHDVIKTQPGSAEKTTVKSSSASDTTQSVLIRGIVSGYEMYESVALSGVTVATAGNTYSRILSFSKDAETAGYVTLMENDETVVLGILPMEKETSQYRKLIFQKVPSGSREFVVRYKRRVTPLNADDDYPIIEGSGKVLELGALSEAWRSKRQFRKAEDYDVKYEIAKAKLIGERVDSPNKPIQMVPMPLNRDEGIL